MRHLPIVYLEGDVTFLTLEKVVALRSEVQRKYSCKSNPGSCLLHIMAYEASRIDSAAITLEVEAAIRDNSYKLPSDTLAVLREKMRGVSGEFEQKALFRQFLMAVFTAQDQHPK